MSYTLTRPRTASRPAIPREVKAREPRRAVLDHIEFDTLEAVEITGATMHSHKYYLKAKFTPLHRIDLPLRDGRLRYRFVDLVRYALVPLLHPCVKGHLVAHLMGCDHIARRVEALAAGPQPEHFLLGWSHDSGSTVMMVAGDQLQNHIPLPAGHVCVAIDRVIQRVTQAALQLVEGRGEEAA